MTARRRAVPCSRGGWPTGWRCNRIVDQYGHRSRCWLRPRWWNLSAAARSWRRVTRA